MLDWLFAWLQAAIDWAYGVVKSIFGALWDFLQDVVVAVADAAFSAILALLNAIPVPDFLSNYSLGFVLGGLPADLGFFFQKLRLTEAVVLLGAGVGFRMLRKLFTLGQW